MENNSQQEENQLDIELEIFSDLISTIDFNNNDFLPINHIAKLDYLEDFGNKGKIPFDYLGEKCEVFNQDLLYFFYGRASFKLHEKSVFPICFVYAFDDEIFKIFPFDSGAFYHKRMSKYFNEDDKLEHFEVSNDINNIFRIVTHFYEDRKKYYFGEVNENFDGKTEPSAFLKYFEMIKDENSEYLDERRKTIELIYDKSFSLTENKLKYIILPYQDFNFNAQVMEYTELKELLETNYGCKVLNYKSSQKFSDIYENLNLVVNKIINDQL